jgi:hypothetical protein
VVAIEGQVDRYVVIDGYKRVTALEQLGRDQVEVVVWPMNEAEAIVLDRSLRLSEHEINPSCASRTCKPHCGSTWMSLVP